MDTDTMRGRISPDAQQYTDSISEMCNAPYAVRIGLELVSASLACVKTQKTLSPEDLNSNHVAHGGIIFGVIDHTAALLSNMGYRSVGQSVNVIYHRPCVGPIIECEAKILNDSRSLTIIDARVYCGGKLVASAVCTSFKTDRKTPE
jgi:acyl-CoA thioesterase